MTLTNEDGMEVLVDDEGFLVDPSEWDEHLAARIAAEDSMGTLSERQWEVVRFMRKTYEEKGEAPNVRALSKLMGISVKELYELFPRGPAKEAAKIAGVHKPHGCI